MMPSPIIGENQVTFYLPEGTSGYIIGLKAVNLKRMKKQSGADIQISGKRNQPCQAIITGTKEQCDMAVNLLRESLKRSHSFSPILGFTLLDCPNYNFDAKLLSFNKILNDNDNDYDVFPNVSKDTINYHKYTLEMIDKIPSSLPSPPSSKNSTNFNTLSGKIYSFTIINQLPFCLDKIIKKISSQRDEFRLKINFGRYLFTKIDQTNLELNLSEWNQLKRGHDGITTAFCHKSFFEDEKTFQKLKEIFNFEQVNVEQECSVNVIYMGEDKKKNQFKLQYDSNDACWKITKSTKNIRRQAIIDIVSGKKDSPDLRFLLKSQKRSSPINEKYLGVINDLQKSKKFLERMKEDNNKDKMYFMQQDFHGDYECMSVRQSIIKKRLSNDKYQMNFISTLQDENGRITVENTVNLINTSWISSPPLDYNVKCESLNPSKSKFKESIIETINYARKISEIIGDNS